MTGRNIGATRDVTIGRTLVGRIRTTRGGNYYVAMTAGGRRLGTFQRETDALAAILGAKRAEALDDDEAPR